MKSSFKTGRQRRTNQQKLKRSKAALASRKANREMEQKNTIHIKGSVTKGVTRYRTQSRWSAFKAWAGEKLSKFRGLFKTKKQKEQDRLWEMHMGQGLGLNRFLKEENKPASPGGGSDGRYYREAIDPPPVPHIEGIYG
jgi:hypothetical protein